MVGPLTRLCIQHLNFHKAFIGIDGWDAVTGFTGRDMLRCDVVNVIMEKQTHTVAPTDSSKFGQLHPFALAPTVPFKQVITDSQLSPVYQDILRQQPLELTLI